MKKNTNITASSNSSELTLEQLAALSESNAPQFAKTGNPDPNRDDGVLELDADTITTTITGVSLSARKVFVDNQTGATRGFATPQAVLTFTLADGRTTQAGIDLPIGEGDGMALGMSGEEETIYTQKSGDKFLKFLRAISPTKFNVFASLDKETNPWTYYGFDGEVMSAATKAKRADMVNKSVMVVAGLIRKGDYSQVLNKAVGLRRVTNPNSPKYPYNNFSVVDGE